LHSFKKITLSPGLREFLLTRPLLAESGRAAPVTTGAVFALLRHLCLLSPLFEHQSPARAISANEEKAINKFTIFNYQFSIS
jgi:hypothetical protein